jgi:adenylate kinase
MKNIVIFGAPGAGKGTQCKILSEKLGLIHISTGDLIRKEISEKSEVGIKAEAIISKGLLLDDATVSSIFLNALKKHLNSPGFLFDGYPRTVKQAEILEKILKDLGLEITIFVEITLSAEEAVKRLLKRAEIEGRIDDNPETVRARFEEYNRKTAPVRDHYIRKGIYKNIEGTGKIEDINGLIIEIILQ